MSDIDILTWCSLCDVPINIGEKQVGIITCLARCSEYVVNVEDAVQFKSFCAVCATDMDFRFLFPKSQKESAERLQDVILGRESNEPPEDYAGIGHCSVCFQWIAEGNQFRTIEAERSVIVPEGAKIQSSLSTRCYCKSCSELFDFEATEVCRRGHGSSPSATPPTVFRGRSEFFSWKTLRKN